MIGRDVIKSPRVARVLARVDLGLLNAALCVVLLAAPAAGQETTRVSVDSAGVEGNRKSQYPSISADGQLVAFFSDASNLVAGDTNGREDVFVHDRLTGTTERVSVDSSGSEGNYGSSYPAISADGQIVTFQSYASNLVAGDRNGWSDIFVHNRTTGRTRRVSVDSSGAEANGSSYEPSISANGRIVAFQSYASNLVAGDRSGYLDVFVHNRTTGITERVSVDSSGSEANYGSSYPAISADGLFVAFQSEAWNLVAGDTNGWSDVFVHDRSTGNTERVSVDSSGVEGNIWSLYPSISADGQIVGFHSYASNLIAGDTNGTYDVFVRDRSTGITERVSVDSSGLQGNGSSAIPSISADGLFVAFYSTASNLVSGDTNGFGDVFVHDRSTGITDRVSVDSSGVQGNGYSLYPSISADGQIVAFESGASNLVSGDTNGRLDVFIHEPCFKVDATWSNYGAGFPGSTGVPPFTSRGDPVLGSTLTLDLGNSYGNDTPGLFLVGYQEAVIPTNRGGDLLLIPAVITLLNVRWTGITIEGDVPDQTQLCGIEIFLQALEIDPGAAKGVSFTAGLKLVLGL